MKEYDDANLNYQSGFTPEVKEFLRRDGRTLKDGQITVAGENDRDRARQKEALLATAETGEALLTKATQSFVERMQKMIAATDAGQSWPPA